MDELTIAAQIDSTVTDGSDRHHAFVIRIGSTTTSITLTFRNNELQPNNMNKVRQFVTTNTPEGFDTAAAYTTMVSAIKAAAGTSVYEVAV